MRDFTLGLCFSVGIFSVLGVDIGKMHGDEDDIMSLVAHPAYLIGWFVSSFVFSVRRTISITHASLMCSL